MKLKTQAINDRNYTRINNRRQNIIHNLYEQDLLTIFSLKDLASYFYVTPDIISTDINILKPTEKNAIILPSSGDELMLKLITDKRYADFKEHVENGGNINSFLFANGISKEPLPYGKSYDVVDKYQNISLDEYTDVYNVNPKRTTFNAAIKKIYNNPDILKDIQVQFNQSKESKLCNFFSHNQGQLDKIKECVSKGYSSTMLQQELGYSEKSLDYITKMLAKNYNIIPPKDTYVTEKQKNEVIKLIKLGKTQDYISSITGIDEKNLNILINTEIYPENPNLKQLSYYKNCNKAQQIISYLEKGYSESETAIKIDMTRSSVINILNEYMFSHPLEAEYVQVLRNQGRYMTKVEISNEDFDMCIDLRLERPELSVFQIAKLVNVTENQVNLALQKAGLDVASEGYIQNFQDNEQSLIVIDALKELGYKDEKIAALMDKTPEWVDKKYTEAIKSRTGQDIHGVKSDKLYKVITSNKSYQEIAKAIDIPISTVANYKCEYKRNVRAGVLDINKGNIKQNTYDITHKYNKEIYDKQRPMRTTKENKIIFGTKRNNITPLPNKQDNNQEYTREE